MGLYQLRDENGILDMEILATSAGVYHYGCLWTDFEMRVGGVYCGLVEARSAISDGYVSSCHHERLCGTRLGVLK